MTLFIADGKINNVAAADCPRCHGTGFFFGPVGFTEQDTFKYELLVCNCIEVKLVNRERGGG